MGTMRKEEPTKDIITILNTTLQVEYSNVVNWPHWVLRIKEQSGADKLRRMATDSMKHFDTTYGLIRQLGGNPVYSLKLEVEDDDDIRETLHKQLDTEKLAKMGYQMAAELAPDEKLRQTLMGLAAAEEGHIRLLQAVLSELAPSELGTRLGDSA